VALREKPPAKGEIEVLRAASLAKIPWLVHGFSTRHGGVSQAYGGNALNLGFTTHDSRSAVENNRQAFACAVLASPASSKRKSGEVFWPILGVRQIHSDLIHLVSSRPDQPPAGDGLITRTPGLLLTVLAADCLPIVIVDTKHRAVGIFHAGWRGTLKRIAEKGAGELQRHFRSRPADMKAVIGPGIRDCCYQVGPEVREKFEGQFGYAQTLFRAGKESDMVRQKYPLLFLNQRAPGHGELPKEIFLNLAEANRRQLVDAGINPKNISDLNGCTCCRPDLFFSHRAEKGMTGRMGAVVGIRAILNQ
jgi:polyphenol oxidase